jgi:hypothetical protein
VIHHRWVRERFVWRLRQWRIRLEGGEEEKPVGF